MLKKISTRLLTLFLAAMLVFSACPMQMLVSAATTVTVLDGQVSITDTATNMSESGGTVTVSAKGGLLSQTTNTITICNESESTAELTFDYSASNYSSFSETSASGTKSVLLDAGATCTMSIKGKRALSSNTATLTLSNFSLTAAASSSNVTFDYDSAYGSVTIDGTAVSSGDVVEEVPLTGAALVATAANGGSFSGWVNAADNSILSTDASYTITPATDMTVKAVFVGANSAPHFMIGALVNESYKHGLLNLTTSYYPTVPLGTHIFDDLNDAAQASASSSTSKAIVLLNDSTLPAGDYTIPSGSTLVIPMDKKNTFYTTEPRGREYNNDLDGDGTEQSNDPTKTERYQHTITAYRTLTMASGANITVNGGMSVPAMHLWAQGGTYGGGSPCDGVGMVVMEEGSSITVNSGGVLYAYGFITGSGSVTANSGAKVYEYFQIPDFRGGTQSTDMENGVFPLSQYYVQNIEVPLKLNSGAQEYSYTTLYMSAQDVSSSVAFIGPSNSMFNLTSGYVIKRYDSSTDRLIIELSGNMTVSPVTMNLGGSSLDSSEYELPINSNITVKVNSGSNIIMGQDIAMLPGSEIIISEGANCTLNSGINIYIYDLAQWGNYAGATNQKFIPVVNIAPIPGRIKYTRTEKDLTDAKIQIDGYIDASAGCVYTTSSGANVFSTGTGVAKTTKGSETVTYALAQGTGYVQIPIKPVWLKNADGSYVQTGTDTYNYDGSKWVCTNHSYESVVTAPTCDAKGYTTYTCVACGDSYVDDYVDTVAHTYNSVVTAPTCSEQGYTTYTCSVCGYSYVDDKVDALGHNYESVITPPTCQANGFTTHTCTVCGDSYIDGNVDPLAHDYNSVVTAPTCTENGYTTYSCKNCTYSYVGDNVDALGHDYATVVFEPTCTESGYTTYTCTRCNDTYNDDETPAKGHSYVSVVTAPTCTVKGYTTHTCSVCDDSYTDSETATIDHNYGDWIVDKAADCETDGTQHKVCSMCSGVINETIPATGHDYSEEWTVDTEATDVFEGSKSRHCANCDSKTDVTAIPAKTDFLATLSSVTAATITGYKGADEAVLKIPYALDGYMVKTIAENAFADFSNIKYVVYEGTMSDWEYIDIESGNEIITNATIVYLRETVGDFDADGEVNSSDLVELRNAILNDNALTEKESYIADANGDGKVDARDLVRLKKYIAGVDVLLGVDYFSSIVTTYRTNLTVSSQTATVTPALSGVTEVCDYETFVFNVALLEELAYMYTAEVAPGKDPLALVINYIRTGVDRYNSGSWKIMAGDEDVEFTEFVAMFEEGYNAEVPDEEKLYITALKNIKNFYLPNGNLVDLGHMFGTMDITYHNKGSQNHADVGGWAGDLVDLLELADKSGVSGSIDEMVEDIRTNYFGKDHSPLPTFNSTDYYGDIDAYYILNELDTDNYSYGMLFELMLGYFTEELSDEYRAEYFLKNRIGTNGTRNIIREAVYNEYISNNVIKTLEGTREFASTDLISLRKACCYAFADYLCSLAGDYVDDGENIYYTEFESETSILAPGITQELKKATSADNKQMVYYIATADITRDDVQVFANYHNNDPTEWQASRVMDQANAAQEKYGNPESEHYIKNYNVIASINGAGYNMSTGEPSGLLVMGGVEYHAINGDGFFGILKDGTAVIGSTQEYNTIYKDKVQEGIAGFGSVLIKDGKVVVAANANHTNSRATRTAVGITKTGKVVFMVLDGRQEPVSCGGSMNEIAQIMLEAGCVNAVNLDGGGSSTYVARQVGDSELSLMNVPSDGYARNVSTSLMMVSTAPSSTEFDHAVLETEYNYLTIGTSLQVTPKGVSATGNPVELPEGTTWRVSDERWATISEDGVITAHRNGTVTLDLMLGEDIIGTREIDIVEPTNIYYERNIVDAIYGEAFTLPIKAVYENKPVAINENDITFTLSSETAGVMDGFSFTGDQSAAIKDLTITASLTANTDLSANITVRLHNKDDVTFDFDNADGGDRKFAWKRKVTNSETEDNVTYTAINKDEKMETSYVVALDMTAIPIPAVLSDLIYMIPGADAEGATAWALLCQLAERISPLSEVKAVLNFDTRFDVDITELELINDYFVLSNAELDTATNTVTITMNWIDQTKAIDQAGANPLCMVNGIKVTPKADADWGAKNSITAINTGDISYNIYMRASALYSFAQKPENQEQYNILPYVNPNDSKDAGGYFGDTYTKFDDTFTLSKAVQDGWVIENGGFAYYVEGEKLTGIQLIDGYYYDFGQNGINIGQTVYTGVFFDESVNAYRYSKNGVLEAGWQTVNSEWYYFSTTTYKAATGRVKMFGIYYTFEETGRLSSGVWAKTFEGTRYYYGPSYHYKGWYNIDGIDYFFKNGYRCEGIDFHSSSANPTYWYDFGPDGSTATRLNGIYLIDGSYRYFEDGLATEKHLFKWEGDYYYARYNGFIVTNETIGTASTNCDLPKGRYTFGADGKMLGASPNGEIVEIDGVLYYYENGRGVEKYLVKVGNDYYFAQYGGKLIVNKVFNAWATNCDLPKGTYTFGADGRVIGVGPTVAEIVEIDGVLYYYENGKGVEKGLIKYNGDYYFAQYRGKLVTNQVFGTYLTNCDLRNGRYEFGADGKMLQGIVEKDGVLYYYENGVGVEKGLIKYNGDYYFAQYKGKLVTNQVFGTYLTNCDLRNSRYEFGADGKMLQGIVEKDGVLYYYENGVGVEKGLFKYNGDYYFALYRGVLITNMVYGAYMTNCDLPKGRYEFGADGKMLNGMVEKDGVLYYYENGVGVEKGLFEYNGDYYFAEYRGKIVTNKVFSAYMTNCDLPKGRYEFGADGKMLNGIVNKDGVLYYYENGVGVEKGLFYYEGHYYFSQYKGKLITNQVFKIYQGNGLLVEQFYTFNELGQIIG